ncbi:VOC family protein [Pleomorphomonas koreensis]|uniref:VOC family protein n=1 Tax=Pleomorphomonas koreensis TaxID=257440 RepID=UPI00040752F5|nr:VOC family protein [Pleomorphomonas koreensis]
MLDHMGFPAVDFEKSKTFYDKALAPLGVSMVMAVSAEESGSDAFAGYGSDGKPDFWVASGRPAGEITHFHVAFVASDRATVDAFYAAAMAAGGRDNGGPGLRPHYHPNYYAAFVFDPDGNNIEAVCHKPE